MITFRGRLRSDGYGYLDMLAISHNPNDLVDWIWAALTFVLVAALVLLVVVVVLRVVQAARSSTTENDWRGDEGP